MPYLQVSRSLGYLNVRRYVLVTVSPLAPEAVAVSQQDRGERLAKQLAHDSVGAQGYASKASIGRWKGK